MTEIKTQNSASTPASMPTALEALIGDIQSQLGAVVLGTMFSKGEATLNVARDGITTVLKTLRDRYQFSQLIDVCGMDEPSHSERFVVVYHLLSMTKNLRVRLKVRTSEGVAVPSACEVFPVANWFEREAYDLYGIYFDDHPDLRRILTDYGFEGHPLRKDFPLTGYVELRYDEEQKRVVYSPVELIQDFRAFDYLSPWEGMTDVQLPGDEKSVQPKFGWKPVEKVIRGKR